MSILRTSALKIEVSIEADIEINNILKKPKMGPKIYIFTIKTLLLLKHILFIYYLVRFQKDQAEI